MTAVAHDVDQPLGLPESGAGHVEGAVGQGDFDRPEIFALEGCGLPHRSVGVGFGHAFFFKVHLPARAAGTDDELIVVGR
ncbi:hypothetical protein SDC9_91321 [bioreactor metagenome]|uniref:Uncharacterized protein n=1 Tax=bioreactor metagenome TaxID=1076179 RepID=A0A644ZUX6_9ZZZZ